MDQIFFSVTLGNQMNSNEIIRWFLQHIKIEKQHNQDSFISVTTLTEDRIYDVIAVL